MYCTQLVRPRQSALYCHSAHVQLCQQSARAPTNETGGVVGMELRRMRNFRGLKPSQLARMGGHPGLARLLSEAPPGRSSRRRHRRGLDRQRHTISPDALLAVLVQVELSLCCYRYRSLHLPYFSGLGRECVLPDCAGVIVVRMYCMDRSGGLNSTDLFELHRSL